MVKDPAINWYFDNWCGGTKGFSRHQKGCYIDLLEAQFYLGHLSLEEIKNILGPDFNQWNFLKRKFEQDERGYYFNERMELEKNKRQKFITKQQKNGSKGGRPKKPKENPIHNPNETQKKAFNGIEIETGFETEKGEWKIGGMGESGQGEKTSLIPRMMDIWLKAFPEYAADQEYDFPALGKLAEFICKQEQIIYDPTDRQVVDKVISSWNAISRFCAGDNHYSTYSIARVQKHIQSVIQAIKHAKKQPTGGKVDINAAFAKIDEMYNRH